MADWSRRERNIRLTEFVVPRNSAAAEFDKAWIAAIEEWDARNPDRRDRPDHWAFVDADDEHIIIRLTVESGS